MSRPSFGMDEAGKVTRPTRSRTRDEVGRLDIEVLEQEDPVSSPDQPTPVASAVADIFEARRRPSKKSLNTYVTTSTMSRLDWFVRKHEFKTTDVVDKAIARLLDEVGVPQTDADGNLLES